jgi:hypothetical protein
MQTTSMLSRSSAASGRASKGFNRGEDEGACTMTSALLTVPVSFRTTHLPPPIVTACASRAGCGLATCPDTFILSWPDVDLLLRAGMSMAGRRGADHVLSTPVTDLANSTDAFFHRCRASTRPAAASVTGPKPSSSNAASRVSCDATSAMQMQREADPLASSDDEEYIDGMDTLCVCEYSDDEDEPLPLAFQFPLLYPMPIN